MRYIVVLLVALVLPVCTNAGDFKIEFTWDGLKRCTSGRPNIVSNPIFKVMGVPKGTVGIDFRLKDLNVPSYNHGGGWIDISKDGKVAANSFKYKSPCPPSGKHKYEWTAKAKEKKGWGGKTLATTKVSRMYPE